MTTFGSLGLSDPLLRAVEDLGYVAPTPVQTAAIPVVLSGRDLCASAQTGSGKTAAFVLPLLERLAAQSPSQSQSRERLLPVRALVLVPTRELAAQIGEVIESLGRNLRLKACVAVGGVSINPQMMALRGGADIVVATPGRLLDLVEHNALRLGRVQMLVLDEADRLLSLGFADELARILDLVSEPGERQSLLFSATFPAAVRALASSVLRDPIRIDIDPPPALIVQRAIEVDASKRTMLLRHLLQTHAWSSVLVFVASRYAAEHLTEKLRRAKISACALHGDLSQGARTQALADLRAGDVQVLVATDVAARGLDVVALSAVVNYDLPRSPVEYLHRIGRTGRAGETGTAVSFVTANMAAHFNLIEKRHHLRLERERIKGFEPTDAAPPLLDPQGGIKGKRKSKKDKLREAAARK